MLRRSPTIDPSPWSRQNLQCCSDSAIARWIPDAVTRRISTMIIGKQKAHVLLFELLKSPNAALREDHPIRGSGLFHCKFTAAGWSILNQENDQNVSSLSLQPFSLLKDCLSPLFSPNRFCPWEQNFASNCDGGRYERSRRHCGYRDIPRARRHSRRGGLRDSSLTARKRP